VLTAANNAPVQSLVVRMSFTDATPGSAAILYSMFALSSLHISNYPQALAYKFKAAKAIRTSAAQYQAAKDAFQRIVALNLLALFEVSFI
jgi:hypothetical protein